MSNMTEKEFIPKAEEIKETKEKEPKMRLKFFFSPHLRKEDFALLREEIRNCDVYVPEMACYKSETVDTFQKISSGRLGPEEAADQFKKKYRKELPDEIKGMLEAIYDLKKPVYFVDIPLEHKLTEKVLESSALAGTAFSEFLSGNFARALTKGRRFIEIFCSEQKERNKYIKENIEQLKPKLLKDHPNFKNEKEIKILISLGAAHTPLYHQFKKEGKTSTQQSFVFLPYIHSTADELVRRKELFPEKELKDGEIARALIENIFLASLKKDKAIKNTTELVKVSRFLSSKFSKEDVKNFSEMIEEKYSHILPSLLTFALSNLELNRRELFEPPLEEFGVKLPETREEVEKIIKKAEKKVD